MVQPAAISISESASRNVMPSLAASRRPIEVFPAPINPIRTMLRPATAGGSGAVSFRAVLRGMAADASTRPYRAAKSPPESQRAATDAMSRIFLVVVVAGLVLIGVAVVILCAFPPHPSPHEVQRVLPNDKFQGH